MLASPRLASPRLALPDSPSKGSPLERFSSAGTNTKSFDRKALPVYISVNVVSLFAIDTLEETFTVNLNVTLMWSAAGEGNILGLKDSEELLHLVKGLDNKDIDWEPNWYPNFGVRNKEKSEETYNNFVAILIKGDACKSDEEWDRQIEEGTLRKDRFWVLRDTTMTATINKSQSLKIFPFDIQRLSIMIRMEHPSSQIDLKPIEDLPKQVSKRVPRHIAVPQKAFAANFHNLDTAEFHVWRGFPCTLRLANDFMNRERRFQCGAIQVDIFVKRHMGHYFYNVFMMVFLITSITAASWAIKPTDIESRLATDVALLLTGQAFKLVIADKLPKVNYLTAVDIYILGCFGFIVMGTAMHVYVGWYNETNVPPDMVLLKVWLSVWGLFNVIFLIVVLGLRKNLGHMLKRHQAEIESTRPLSEYDVLVDEDHNEDIEMMPVE